jgi:phospholipid-binding lipoprotein MlaA
MKALWVSILLLAFVVVGCAHNANSDLSPAPTDASLPVKQEPASARVAQQIPPSVLEVPAVAVAPKADEFGDITEFDEMEKESGGGKADKPEIADPLEPFNRAMYQFNDKLYFWVLKPVAEGYGRVVPEPARVGVDNFFQNLAFPIRFVNCLIQVNFRGAAEELGRFAINTIWGVGGFLDPASSKEIDLAKQDEDFGQTLGTYGIGQGFYITWPIFGPSSPRDTVGLVGDTFLRPLTYVSPWYAGTGARAYGMVNDTSLRIGDYEALKGAAVDPYVAIRDAYVQYRLKKIQRKGGSPLSGETGLQEK